MFKLQGIRQQSTKFQILCMPLLLASQMQRFREGFFTSPVEMPVLFQPFAQLPILTYGQLLKPTYPSSFPPNHPADLDAARFAVTGPTLPRELSL